MNMFLHELRSYRKSTIIWTLSILALIAFFFSIYPSMSSDVSGIEKLLEGYPEAVKKALGISLESFSTIPGFYATYVFLYAGLCGSIQAMNLGLSCISKEYREKTADFLLTKPVTRKEVITAKLLAVLTCLIITNIFCSIGSAVMASAVSIEPFDMKILLMISISMFFIQLMFMSLGVVSAVVITKIRSVIAISLSTVFSLYIIGMLYSVIDIEGLKYITPFKYYDPTYIIKNASYETTFVIIEVLFIAVSIGLSYYIYSKKDIHAV